MRLEKLKSMIKLKPKLSHKLSEAILQAIEDVEELRKINVVIAMSRWVTVVEGDSDYCSVCLAGAALICRNYSLHYAGPTLLSEAQIIASSFAPDNNLLFACIDKVRRGWTYEAVEQWPYYDNAFKKYATKRMFEDDCMLKAVPDYKTDWEGFIKCLTEISDYLKILESDFHEFPRSCSQVSN